LHGHVDRLNVYFYWNLRGGRGGTVMHVDLTPLQRDMLLQLVDEAVREIGPEIRHSDRRDYRDDLKLRRRELRQLHDALVASAMAAARDASTGDMIGTP
jgi:hypothetical protein